MNPFDEIFQADGSVREHYGPLLNWLGQLPSGLLSQKTREAEALFRKIGITFAVYGDEDSKERLIPSDPIPRIVPAEEWAWLSRGLEQRVRALNLFLADVYGKGHFIKEGYIPESWIYGNAQFQSCMLGHKPLNGVFAQICGVDLIRDGSGYYVLEDNLRVPSGVSYMMQNRKMMQRLFPDLFKLYAVAPVDHYGAWLRTALRESTVVENPTLAVLTPGPFNSAYYEHAFLAQQMGVELVEGRDLFVQDAKVWMRTIRGPQRVDVLYRRLDDAFLDPLCFRSDSILGVPGLMQAHRAGGVVLANSVGTGVADDKSIYPFVPDMIRFYLSEEPILQNVPTRQLSKKDDLLYTLENLDKLVVKEVHGAGGYGMLVGPASTQAERDEFKQKILASPESYISQPTLSLSSCGIWLDESLQPRHIDLRPFVLSGREVRITPGGLTRVALREGSLVVNSSQGGGTKDTWVLEGESC